MKKVIKGKTYNTEYDSQLICKYTEKIDGWAVTRYSIYKKKSSGEYFQYKQWSQWNDGWDIGLISEKEVESVMKEVKSGMTYKYCALQSDCPGTKQRGYFWGTSDDDPWDEMKVKERKIKEKKKILEEEEKEEAAGKKVWGILEITRCSNGVKFKKAYGKEVPADIVGEVLYYKVNFRIKNSNFDKGKGYNGWYRYSTYVIQCGGTKASAKEIFMNIVSDVVKEMGEFEPVMKGGELVESPKKNREMVKDIKNRIMKLNKKVIWGE